ncbi:hypothetical protein FFM81_015645 [Rhizobium hidalgonense]|nr:hypothetical protein FFM81_015645 [Rhizobium hidalgonense]
MFRYLGVAILTCVPLVAANAASPDFCRNRIEPNEPLETRFMGLDYALMIHVLAEKYCGAEPTPMRPRFLGYIQKQGCPPGTEIYSDVEETIAKLEGASLKLLAQNGDPDLPLSERQVQDWAANAAKELGGCDALKSVHDAEFPR